ncbi:Non-specific serine/threonine protein kinase [Purpureocillium takamizusanense]|uniref:non-specific serine/threonine protein kinase n=1 Tax=Purpureocillium takamizusanense TaxID=2060973 RepID=A0A9Q8Q986_9HYPO|nr:Non-specific serine/threonine protein kinase [Purpureocillium takamizusanense]UNI14776.1 Non-specific serine/threonine protein kinase [Purpureocillium takamizusanense]
MPGINPIARTAATDDEGVDQIGSDTPRSGIATPQPDLQDKRLPGIMSYFGQVRPDPPATETSSHPPPVEHAALREHGEKNKGASATSCQSQVSAQSSVHCGGRTSHEAHPSLPSHGTEPARPSRALSHPYPTPPASQPSSSGGSMTQDVSLSLSNAHARAAFTVGSRTGKESLEEGRSQASDALSEVAASAGQSGRRSTSPQQPTPLSTSLATAPASSSKWFSLEGLKELTRGTIFKSGPPTPTRALSAAHSSQSDGRDTPGRTSHDGAEHSGTQTPRNSTSAGAQVPLARGKLTIKIVEARGLRKCRDPYVVAVFQRSELISGGPRPSEEDEHNLNAPTSVIGSIPIQRQGSDSGRPMAIPMRSRQSSNTSITDYNTFRNRTTRTPSSNPKWDAEAVFDVVDSDMAVAISVYDHMTTGEEFLGQVDFQASRDDHSTMRSWYTLKGHADTVAEDAPTGEIYVECLYQRSEKKQFGPSDFEILKLIGKGTFGQVYQVRKRDTQRIYAMKVLQKKVIVQKKEVAHTVGERNILVRTAMSDSPFIVGLKFSFQTPSELYLVTDYMSGGELFWHLQKEGRFDERRAKFYIAELILAIQHLHNNDIVYRDLKPENILLDANGHIALCDFGLSKANLTKNDTTNTFCGTTEYLAPEVLLDESGYTKMVDFWSLGVLVFEMCCGWSPFYAEDTQQMYKNIAFGKVRFPRDTLSQEGRNFVKGLLNRNPKHRLGATEDAKELMQHPFFADIDWDLLAKKLITPPFKPKLKSETDVSYFDPEFTTALEQNGSLNERAAALARGYAASTPLSPSVQANFQGFTFVDESALDDHMKDRFRSSDDDMDDAHGAANNDDDDWDNLDDIDPRKANRMSGIVKTSHHDEHLVGGSHFDP